MLVIINYHDSNRPEDSYLISTNNYLYDYYKYEHAVHSAHNPWPQDPLCTVARKKWVGTASSSPQSGCRNRRRKYQYAGGEAAQSHLPHLTCIYQYYK